MLGIDPGSVTAGIALIERISPGQGRWLEAGNVPSTHETASALLERLRPDLVVVEEPVWIGGAGIAKAGGHLLMASWQGGGWLWLAKAMGIRAEAIYAREWRLWLTGKVGPKDALIAACLPRALANIPKRTNNHERDAAGVAWAGLRLPANWTEMRRRAAEMKQQVAGAKAQARKLAKARAA